MTDSATPAMELDRTQLLKSSRAGTHELAESIARGGDAAVGKALAGSGVTVDELRGITLEGKLPLAAAALARREGDTFLETIKPSEDSKTTLADSLHAITRGAIAQGKGHSVEYFANSKSIPGSAYTVHHAVEPFAHYVELRGGGAATAPAYKIMQHLFPHTVARYHRYVSAIARGS